jgi:hypothetical protein
MVNRNGILRIVSPAGWMYLSVQEVKKKLAKLEKNLKTFK